MGQTVTLQLPNNLASTAQVVAQRTKRPVEDVLVEWLDRAASQLPVDLLSDEQLLALTTLEMSPEQQKELSSLLAIHREGELREEEQQSLDRLMQIYRRGLVRKAEAIQVAVARGLIPPLS